MNSFNKNKEIVEVCKNYYTIVNAEIYEGDEVTLNIIKLYEDFIFGMDIVTKREKEKLEESITIMLLPKDPKVSKGVHNLVEYVMNKMIVFFEDYKDIYTRNIYIPRWI